MENVVCWITLQAGKPAWLEKSLGWKWFLAGTMAQT